MTAVDVRPPVGDAYGAAIVHNGRRIRLGAYTSERWAQHAHDYAAALLGSQVQTFREVGGVSGPCPENVAAHVALMLWAQGVIDDNGEAS